MKSEMKSSRPPRAVVDLANKLDATLTAQAALQNRLLDLASALILAARTQETSAALVRVADLLVPKSPETQSRSDIAKQYWADVRAGLRPAPGSQPA